MDMFVKRYSNVSEGPKQWQEIKTEKSSIYNWDENSTYVKKPPFFENLSDDPEGFKEIKNARPLLILGDMNYLLPETHKFLLFLFGQRVIKTPITSAK